MDETGSAQGKQPGIPEMVAATEKPFFMSAGQARVAMRIHPPTGPVRHRQPGSEVVFLLVENVTCDKAAPTFNAYFNVPAGELPEHHPELFAGSMGMFGLPEASAIHGEHGDSGKGFTLDVTELFHKLRAGREWDAQQLTISFVPSYWDAPVPQVKVGRVSLYLQ